MLPSRSFLRVLTAGLVLAAAFCLTASSAHAQKGKKPGGGGGPAYTILPFAPLGVESRSTETSDLNEVGEVVGRADSNEGGTTSWHLDLLSGEYTLLPGYVAAINNVGQMVGQTSDYWTAYFLADVNADPVLIPPLMGDDHAAVSDINDDGLIVGWSRIRGTDLTTAVVWRAVVDGEGDVAIMGPAPLSPLSGDTTSWGFRINDPLEGPILVTGGSGDAIRREAVVWSLGVNEDGELEAGPPAALGTLGLLDPSSTYSDAYGINSFGDVCGHSDLMPFLLPAGGEMQILPVPRNTFFGYARDLNDLGAVVGDYFLSYQKGARIVHEQYPFLWRADTGAVDLNKLHKDNKWAQLWYAFRITNGGVIIGRGHYDGAARGFIMILNQ
jgi:hypothetical protein